MPSLTSYLSSSDPDAWDRGEYVAARMMTYWHVRRAVLAARLRAAVDGYEAPIAADYRHASDAYLVYQSLVAAFQLRRATYWQARIAAERAARKSHV